MPTPVSLSAWLEHGHHDDSLLVAEDDYFVPDDAVTPLADTIDKLMAGLPEDERLAVNAVVMRGMSYRDAAVELDMFLTSGVPNKKRAYRLVERAVDQMRRDMARRAPWLSAFLSDPTLLAGLGPVQEEIDL